MEEDHRLIEQIRDSQSTVACTRLVEKYKASVFSLCMRVLRNPEVAEEVAQDAFLKAFDKLRTLDDVGRFKQWLLRITYHMAIDYVRKKKVDMVSIDRAANKASDDSPFGELVNKDRLEVIEMVIEKLEEDERAVVTLYYVDDQSIKQISAITGLSESNVKVRLFRSRSLLKKELDKVKDSL